MGGSIPNRQSLAQISGAGMQALVAAQFPGYSAVQRYLGPAAIVLPAAQTHSVPGPAAGFVRVFVALYTQVTGAAATAVTWELYDGVTPIMLLKRALPLVITQNANTSTVGVANGVLVLGAGESVLVTNAGAADLTLWYRYYDLPDTNLSLMRASMVDTTPVVVIPAAPTGFFRRGFRVGAYSATSSASLGLPSGWVGYNDDTATCIGEASIGGVFTARTSFGAGSQLISPLPLLNEAEITDDALTLALRANVATVGRSFNIAVCYETLPIAA